MHSVSFPARLTRRFAAGSVALAAVLAGVAFAASPAHASTSSTGYCLRAVQAKDFGQIVQYQCDDSDNLQNWTSTFVNVPNGDTTPPDPFLVQVQNNSTGYCLDADAQKVQDYCPIIQWQCGNFSDPYQLWYPLASDYHVQQNVGASA